MTRTLIAAAVTLATIACAQAQSDYPNRPVKIVVNSAPGSATDVTLRIVADRLSQVWGQQVLTLNHVGGGGSIAVRVASQAAPDGYTLYMAAASTSPRSPAPRVLRRTCRSCCRATSRRSASSRCSRCSSRSRCRSA